MKVQTSTLTRSALNWAVAQAAGREVRIVPGNVYPHSVRTECNINFNPSGDWADGGPIFEREISNHERRVGYFYCNKFKDGHPIWATGPTLLIAAMRCYVAWKLGAEVDVPEGLA